MRNNKADSGNGIVSLSYLQMLSIGIKNVSAFDFLEPPPSESVDSAIRQLALIGAVSAEAKPDQQVNGAASKYVFINLCVKSNSPYRTHMNNLKNLKFPGAFETFFNFEPPVSSNGNLFTWYFEGCRKWTGQVRLCKIGKVVKLSFRIFIGPRSSSFWPRKARRCLPSPWTRNSPRPSSLQKTSDARE